MLLCSMKFVPEKSSHILVSTKYVSPVIWNAIVFLANDTKNMLLTCNVIDKGCSRAERFFLANILRVPCSFGLIKTSLENVTGDFSGERQRTTLHRVSAKRTLRLEQTRFLAILNGSYVHYKELKVNFNF